MLGQHVIGWCVSRDTNTVFWLDHMAEPILSSVMVKRSQGQSTFGRMNYKTRVFILTNKTLAYHTGKEADNPGSVKGIIHIDTIKLAEIVAPDALDQQGFPFQVSLLFNK